MLINIKMMTEEAYKTLQKNYKDVYENIINHPSDSTWLESFLGFEPYEEKKYTIEDFELADDVDYGEVAYNNGIILYDHLNELPRYILCNSRFWAWITFEKAYKQAQHSIKITSAQIIRKWWLGNDTKRSLMLGVVSRSFFRIMVSVDEKGNEKYKYCRRLFEGIQNYEIYRFFVDRSMGLIPEVSKGFIKSIIECEETYGKDIIDQKLIREIVKDARKIGSVMLVDTMGEDEINLILMDKIKRRLSNG